MASLHKDSSGRSPYYYCAYYGPDGVRKLKSTKLRDRNKALALCVAWDQAARKGRGNNLTVAQARKVLSEITEIVSGEPLVSYTVKGWLAEWLRIKEGNASPGTITRYRQVTRDFLASLKARATAPLASVTPGDITTYRDELRLEGRAVTTCNMVVKKILSVPFEAARKLGYIPTNPVHAVEPLKLTSEDRGAGRDPFSPDELSRLLRGAGRADWCGAILLGATTGLRLGDVANLQWENVSLDTGWINLETEKTHVEVNLPIHEDFAEWLAEQPRGIGKAPVFPTLEGIPVGGCAGLSAQFRERMEAAGIVERLTVRTGKGRTTSNKGFHCLRHTFISQLANGGVSPEVRRELVGHTDEKSHARYTHHKDEVLREAMDKVPSLYQARCAGAKAK